MKKYPLLLLALLMMIMGLAACGQGNDGGDPTDSTPSGDSTSVTDSGDNANNDVAGTLQGYGDFAALLIPEKFELVPDTLVEGNPHFVSVKKSDFTYFDFRNYTDEAEMTRDYESVKKTYTYEQTPVSATWQGIAWEGFQYGDGFGGYAFEVYTVLGTNYLRVSSAGLAFDHETVKAVLGSVTMADSGSTGDIDTSDSWLDDWSGDWYGWWLMMDGTGAYEAVGEGVWDACARIEVRENMTGYLTLWDEDGSSDTLIAGIELGFANPDDTLYGVMSCEGGQFLSATLESGDWIVNPSEISVEQLIEFSGEYVDEAGTFSYRVVLRPWGTVWDDLDEGFLPAYYADWYLPLIQAEQPMPESIG